MAQFKGRVESLAHGGRGVVPAPNGKIYFVENVWPGDEGLFEITQEKKNYGQADLVELT